MRFRINLSLPKKCFLPFDHQYQLASYITRVIEKVNPVYSIDLKIPNKFRPYTLSYLMAKKREQTQRGFRIDGSAYFFISSPFPEFAKNLAEGMLSYPEAKISKVKGVVSGFRALRQPEIRRKMVFRTLSPIIVRKPVRVGGKLKAKDLFPTDKEFYTQIEKNLRKKYLYFYGEDPGEEGISIRFFEFKPKRHRIRDTYHRGVLGRFEVQGNKRLIRLGYEVGFGEKNGMGFGMVRVG